MMTWEAANAPKVRPEKRQQEDDNSSSPKKRRATETVEAALSRLSRAYTSSMECIGALNKTNEMLLKESEISDESIAVLERVSNAARKTFENGILLDPLVLSHVPTLNETMRNFAEEETTTASPRWGFVLEKRPPPPVLSSAAHKTTIRELAYLALVNYSDLLLSCCICDDPSCHKRDTVLDRGVVRKVQALTQKKRCCWREESREDTERLAVTALCDASNLDGSDPILWLKLACAARGLENIVLKEGDSTIAMTKHRRLQRYALECGTRALPPHMVPNRTVMKALNELNSEPEPEIYRPSLVSEPETIKLTIELPRYSWSMLGRMLMKACREGSDFQAFPRQHRKSQRSIQFGSPTVELRLSPMLVLPSRVLGRICQYLENSSIWRFEATCRALSVSVMAARATMEKETIGTDRPQKPEDKTLDTQPADKMDSATMQSSNENKDGTEGNIDDDTEQHNEQNKSSKKEKIPAQSHRTSKRLRSQLITSGKIAERSSRRKSFDFCFLACTLSETREGHREKMKQLQNTGPVHGDNSRRPSSSRGGSKNDINDSKDSYSGAARERISGSSLSTFVERWTGQNSGPMDLMINFLIHVASHVEDVFASDPSGAVVLTSCILGCFEMCKRRTGFQHDLVQQFFRPEKNTVITFRSIELFATDLLQAELTLRQCDRYSPVHVEFDDDSNQISLMVPALLESCELIEDSIASEINSGSQASLQEKFAPLKVRCYWLAAGFYLWRSRISRMIWEAREAEEEGINFIQEAKKCFESSALENVRTISTPHLVAPGRSESHWKEISRETLTKVRDDIQASSVVSLARQKFLELLEKIEKKEGEKDQTEVEENNLAPKLLSDTDSSAFADIGEILLERYDFPYGDSEAKHGELVEDFLGCHGDEILSLNGKSPSTVRDKLQNMIPLGEISFPDLRSMTNPSILTMLITCLQVKAKHRLKSAEILVHVVMTSIDMHNSLVKRISDAKAMQKGNAGSNEDYSDSDEDSVMSDDASVDRDAANKDADAKRTRQCCHLVRFCIDRIRTIISDHIDEKEQKDFLNSKGLVTMIGFSMRLCSNWYQMNVRRLSLPDDSVDQEIFLAVRNLISKCCSLADEAFCRNVQLEFFDTTAQILLLQNQYLEALLNSQGQRTGRSVRQKQGIKRAEFIRIIAGEMGNILSQNLGKVEQFKLTPSELLKSIRSFSGNSILNDGTWIGDSKLRLLVDCLLSLWKYCSKNDPDGPTTLPAGNTSSSFDKPIVRELRVAIATTVVGMCGSAASTRDEPETSMIEGNDDEVGDQLCLTEFFDSDASAVDWGDDFSHEDDTKAKERKELLRVICHSAYTIHQVLGRIDDKDAISLFSGDESTRRFGPALPLVAVRVLNHFTDLILLNFEGDDGSGDGPKMTGLWAEKFPERTQTAGELLDSNLYKAYRWLYGFALVGEKSHHSSVKDLGSSTAPLNDLAVQGAVPENVAAAAQLYRCIVRAYGTGRRSAPKSSLEIVSSALPPMEESKKSKSLRSFLFASSKAYFTLEDITRLVHNEPSCGSPFQAIEEYLNGHDESEEVGPSELDEAVAVRRGISSQLAKGPLPVVTTDSAKQKSDVTMDDERFSSLKNEEEMSKKFFAILDDICLGGAQGAEAWYRASQCLTMKAELISDRLGLLKGFSRSTDFTIPEPKHLIRRSLTLSQLEAEQEKEVLICERDWVESLGNDLSVYIRYPWSSFSSLLSCTADISNQSLSESERVVLHHFDSLYQSGDYLGWQEAWGGLFVNALRKMSLRFMCLAMYALNSKKSFSLNDAVLKSELCETTGISLYTDLMASQVYGYPMHELLLGKKRDIAIAARCCFQAAVDMVADPSKNDDDSDGRATWDLLFMVGKCNEKVAGTYHMEAFDSESAEGPSKPRMYEKFMGMALKNYNDAYEQAKSIEEDGGFIVDQSGGSAHGSTELLYRVLASRLKCLISAVSCCREELGRAEEEALRLTEQYWFNEQSASEQPGSHVRDRVWKVLGDIVSGLAQCRVDQHYFHRSVYRHAQALMWAPTLYDPTQSDGSLGTVPATRSFQIRGLNNSTHAANSAEVVMSSLFDKRRSQLVAVWVTTTSASSPFQVLNNSTRKYDSLRGKYIMAYLECLKLCQRRPHLETFLKWTSVTRRDLPSYFQSSALAAGKPPAKPHTHDNLLQIGNKLMSSGFLMTVKRQANSALAYIVLKQVGDSSTASDKKKAAENNLKNAYACYLRLHCTKEDLKKRRAFSYGGDTIPEVEAMCQAYLALDGTKNIDTDFGDWSGGARKNVILDAALERCRTLFPSTSGSFFSKKVSSKTKKSDDSADTSSDQERHKTKEKTKKRVVSYEVSVPPDLVEGDTFLTAVKVGGSTQKVRLTVPKGKPSTLRFKLTTPEDGSSPKKSKKSPKKGE